MSAFITLTEAIKMTTDYRSKRKTFAEQTKSEDVFPICETFDKEHVQALLDKPNCSGIRAYFGLDDDDNIKLILVPVNERDEDVYMGADTLLDKAARCPSVCPPSSPLNS